MLLSDKMKNLRRIIMEINWIKTGSFRIISLVKEFYYAERLQFIKIVFAAQILFSLLVFTVSGSEMFADNDRVCFVGDSITHGGSYHILVREYYLTRFPGRTLTTFNCGLSGDTAGGALQRLDNDVLVHKPTAVTVMFGMNDVNRNLYGKKDSEVTEQILGDRKKAIDKYTGNMEKLVKILREKNVKVTLITPTPYEQTAAIPASNFFGCADALAQCAKIVTGLAGQYNTGLISFNQPMTDIDNTLQTADKKATIIGSDRIHPGAFGHAVMAGLFLKDQHVPAEVASVKIDAAKMSVSTGNCKVSGLTGNAGSMTFTCQEEALPMPNFPELDQAEKYIPFTTLFNQEIILVSSLPQGKYAVLIDGQNIGEWPAGELAKGVNIANLNTPQQRQAQQVRTLNRQLCNIQELLRNLYKTTLTLKYNKIDDSNPAALKKGMDDFLEKNKNASSLNYYKLLFSQYQKLKDEQNDNLLKIEELEKNIYASSKPVAHVFELKKI